MKIIVDRSTWGRGKDNGLLLDPTTGCRCCIGFVCQQIGIHDKPMRNVGTVDYLSSKEVQLFEQHFPDCGKSNLEVAYVINDEVYEGDPSEEDRVREGTLTRWGKPLGIEFEFVDGGQA